MVAKSVIHLLQYSKRLFTFASSIYELNGKRGEFYRDVFAKSPAGCPETADEIAHVAELMLSEKGAFIIGSDFLVDGGATAAYFYGYLDGNE